MNALERENLLRIIQKQIHRYPRIEVQDVYKLLYQASCGGEHFLDDPDSAHDRLLAEWQMLEAPLDSEPLVERIDPRNQIVRINLRPFKEQGGLPEQIFALFKRSAEASDRNMDILKEYWNAVTEMAQDVELPFRTDDLRGFWETMAESKFPSVGHGKIYKHAYQPHYRLVLRRYWEGRDAD